MRTDRFFLHDGDISPESVLRRLRAGTRLSCRRWSRSSVAAGIRRGQCAAERLVCGAVKRLETMRALRTVLGYWLSARSTPRCSRCFVSGLAAVFATGTHGFLFRRLFNLKIRTSLNQQGQSGFCGGDALGDAGASHWNSSTSLDASAGHPIEQPHLRSPTCSAGRLPARTGMSTIRRSTGRSTCSAWRIRNAASSDEGLEQDG